MAILSGWLRISKRICEPEVAGSHCMGSPPLDQEETCGRESTYLPATRRPGRLYPRGVDVCSFLTLSPHSAVLGCTPEEE